MFDNARRLKNGFPVKKLGDDVFTFFWDQIQSLNESGAAGNVKFLVTSTGAFTNLTASDPGICVTAYLRCNCGSPHHGQVITQSFMPMCAPDADYLPTDYEMAVNVSHALDDMINECELSGCHCVSQDDANNIYNYFMSKRIDH